MGRDKSASQAGTRGDRGKVRGSSSYCGNILWQRAGRPPGNPSRQLGHIKFTSQGLLGLLIGSAPDLGHEHDGIADQETADPGWYPKGRFCANRLRKERQPFGNGSWIVIDDIVHAGRPARWRPA